MFKTLLLAAVTTTAMAIGTLATPTQADAGGWGRSYSYYGPRSSRAFYPSYGYSSYRYGYAAPRRYSTYYHPQNRYYNSPRSSYYRGRPYGGGFSISFGF